MKGVYYIHKLFLKLVVNAHDCMSPYYQKYGNEFYYIKNF